MHGKTSVFRRPLTRAEQDDIIEATTVAYRITHYYHFGYWPGPEENEESLRAALRLDDERLIKLGKEAEGPLSWST